MPRQRRLAPDLQQEVLEMLELKADKKLIQEKLTIDGNKKVTLRDLANLKAKGNSNCHFIQDVTYNSKVNDKLLTLLKI